MRAVILVPDTAYPHRHDWAYEPQAEVLRRGGFSVEPRRWTELGDCDGVDLITPLVAWGYHYHLDRWFALLDRLEARGIPTLNPVPLLRWNSDKSYLAELCGKGIATVPTRIIDHIDAATLDEARTEFGDELVLKPLASSGAEGTFRLSPDSPVRDVAHDQPMLVQPFMRSVADEGEYSLMLFGGRFSHAIVKRPKPGDFRVHAYLGGSEQPCEPPLGALDLAQQALAEAPAEAVYARVDLIRAANGQLNVIEMELIEPALWLDLAPDGGASFAAAMMERAHQ